MRKSLSEQQVEGDIKALRENTEHIEKLAMEATKPTNTVEEKWKFKEQLTGQEALMSKRQLEQALERIEKRLNKNTGMDGAISPNEALEIVKEELSK